MYEVKIINGKDEKIINAVMAGLNTPRIEGKCKFGINTIDSFTFSILPNNYGYDDIHNLKTLVEIKNTKTNVIEFKGRVLLSTLNMNSSGLFTRNVICESEMGFLMDSIQPYGEYHNVSVRGFLELIIKNHNSQVSDDKKFTVGIVDIEDSNDNLYRFLGYDKTFETIKDKLIDRLGGELRIRYENDVRYLDYVKAIGEVNFSEIRLSKNLVSIEQERDPGDIITRLYPLGAKINDSEERLTISSVNNGVNYIDDAEGIKEFGIIVDTMTWDNVTVADNLLKRAKEYLEKNNKIKKKHNISALDLSIINLDIHSFTVGNTYRVVNPIMGIDEDLRVIEKTLDLNSPHDSKLVVGDKFEDIKDYQIKSFKNEKNIEKVQSTVNTTVQVVAGVNSTLNNTVNSLNDTIKNLNTTNVNVADINKALQDNIKATAEIAVKVTELEKAVVTNTENIDKLKKRCMLGVW